MSFSFLTAIENHWPIWLVSITMVVAAVIDGWKLKVPNWLTFPFIISGWLYGIIGTGSFSFEGLAASLVGTLVGMMVLLPAYSIGGMGAGDVKLFGGVGSWLGAVYLWQGVLTTLLAFCVSAIVGGVLALGLIALRGNQWKKHKDQFLTIATEIATIGNPNELAAIAAKRKSSMSLLPYGIPLTIGTIGYFLWAGMLI